MHQRSAFHGLLDVRSSRMGTKIIIFVCWVAIAQKSVKTENVEKKSGLTDNISAESVSRLYKNVPVGVYASAVPYAAYSFHVPTVLANKNIPVKEETILVQNTNGYLKDSYGNQFLQSPQALAYKTTFPRQSIQLQNLPAHLSQPLVSPSNQFKQSAPHFFSPTQYNVQSIQSVPQTTLSRYTVQPLEYGNIQSLAPNSIFLSQFEPRGRQHQPTGNNVYYNSVAGDNNNKPQNDLRYQHSHETPHSNYHNNNKHPSIQQTAQSDKSQQLQQVPKQTTVTTLSNGKKIAVNLVTKQPVPLLDLNLLEPLTFANPLVPQVQHYLPRINEATYHKLPNVNLEEVKKHQMEFVVQNTKTYDSEDKPKNNQKDYNIKSHEDKLIRPTPTVSVHGSPNESPEFSYEINSPNHKETYSEQKVNYNKETDSEPKTYNYEIKTENKPVHYSYEKNTQQKPVIVSYEHHVEKAPIQYTYEEKTQKEPIHYSYVKTSKEPKQKIHYTTNSQSPKHLVYTIKPDEQANFEQNKVTHHHTRENSGEHSEESHENNGNNEEDDNSQRQKNYGHHIHYIDSPKSTPHLKPEHRQVQYYHTTNQQDPNIVKQQHTPQSFINLHKNISPIQHEQEYFQPIVPEYEEEIKIQPHKVHDEIRVDPNQHIQTTRNSPPRPQNHPVNYDFSRSHYSSAPIIKGKPKQKNNDEPSEEEIEASVVEMFKDQEKNEEDFEKSYKDAAYGFAAYDAPREEFENSEIYNPESYGGSRYHSEYNIEKSPFQQYEAEGDDFPKFVRSNYKDERDKTNEDYFLDYAVSKPTSLRDSFRSKENYYKMFKNNRPEIYYGNQDDDKKNHEKHTYIPTYEYHTPEHKQKQRFTKQKSRPEYEYDYSIEEPRDTSAHGTRPLRIYKSKTQFVEPQFQYGFEPISIPQLLDSELAAMASNDNPKSEKQGTRKKIYKENLYFKKTSTKGGKKISR